MGIRWRQNGTGVIFAPREVEGPWTPTGALTVPENVSVAGLVQVPAIHSHHVLAYSQVWVLEEPNVPGS